MATPETIAEQQALVGINSDYKEKFGFHDSETGYAFKAPKGLTEGLVRQISEFKNEPEWMRDFRLKALDHFLARPMPTWGSPTMKPDIRLKPAISLTDSWYRRMCAGLSRNHQGAPA